jgi:hypothetical protein
VDVFELFIERQGPENFGIIFEQEFAHAGRNHLYSLSTWLVGEFAP